MRRATTLVVAAAVVAIAGLLALLVVADGGGAEGRSEGGRPASQFVCRYDKQPFRVLYAGSHVGRHQLSDGVVECAPPADNPGGPISAVTFLYGECKEAFGCFPGPVNVTVAPLAECHTRHPRARLRGVPARISRDWYEIDLYTGRTGIQITGSDGRAVRAAVRALRSAPRAAIPAPGRAARLFADPDGRLRPRVRLPAPDEALLRVPNSCG
jgi:hypothetical protein